MTNEEKLTMAITPKVLEDFYNQKVAPFLNGSGAMHYSTEEKVVGTWIDGKPIYQKTIDCGALPNNTEKTINNVVPNEILQIIDIRGFIYHYNGTDYFRSTLPTVNWYTSANADVGIYVKNRDLIIRTFTNLSVYTGYATLQYTKTTD